MIRAMGSDLRFRSVWEIILELYAASSDAVLAWELEQIWANGNVDFLVLSHHQSTSTSDEYQQLSLRNNTLATRTKGMIVLTGSILLHLRNSKFNMNA